MSRTLRPTIRSSMWSTIPTPCSQPMSATRSSSATRLHALAVDRHRNAALEADPHDPRLVGRALGRRDELEDVVVGGVVEVLDPAPLRRAAPEVVVDRVRVDLGPGLQRDAVLARVLHLLLAAHLPAAHGRDDLQVGGERRDRRLDADLVVALARAAVGDRVATRPARDVDRELGDQRAPERREQRVAAAVERVGLDRRQDEVAGELLARVDRVAFDRADLARLGLDGRVVLAGLAEVDGQRHDLRLVLVGDPLEHDARVQAAGVQQQDAADLARVGLVGGGSGVLCLVGRLGHMRRKPTRPGAAGAAQPRRDCSIVQVSTAMW